MTSGGQRGTLTLIGASIGSLLLAVPTLVLFGLGVFGASVHGRTLLLGTGLLVVTVGVALGAYYEWLWLRAVLKRNQVVVPEVLRIGAALLVGAVLTIGPVVEFGLSPIVSAAAVGIVVALVTPTYAVPAYCGAFVGMTSPDLFVTYWHTVLASVLAAVVFIIAQPAFHGVGGKLGTTAFVGATLTVFVTAGAFQSEPIPPLDGVVAIVAVAVVGAVVTFSLHTRLDVTPVFASGVVGVVGGIALPLTAAHGELLAAAVFSASFAGMADPKRIPGEGWMGLTGVLVGLALVYTNPFLGGSGGKLGTIAFGSCLAIHAFLRTTDIVRLRRRLDEFPRLDTT